MKKTLVPLFCASLAAIGMLSLALPSDSGGQSGYSKAAFEKTMEESSTRLRILVGSLIAEDWAKAQSAAKSISAEAAVMRGLTPRASPDRIDEYKAHADSLIARSTRMAAAAKGEKGPEAARELGNMVRSCMGCHQVFRH